MKIEIYSKNYSQTKVIENASGPVPRVGENVGLYQDGGYLQGETGLIVYEVEYELENDTLSPVVRCTPFATEENRRFILQNNGWLPKDDNYS